MHTRSKGAALMRDHNNEDNGVGHPIYSNHWLHSGAIPPVVVKTRGLNQDFSMSITLWLYLSFSFL